MKEYRVSKFYRGVYYVEMLYCVVMILLVGPFTIRTIQERSSDCWLGLLFTIGPALLLALIIHEAFFSPLGGRFSFSPEGIALRIGFRTRLHRWDGFRDFGIVPVSVDRDNNCTMWVYCSPVPLTCDERLKFMKTRFKIKDMVYFQYNKEPFAEFLCYVPEEWREELKQQEQDILDGMNFSERIYHR